MIFPSWPTFRAALAVREGPEESVDIPLKSAVTVTGMFVEKDTGKPVPGISAVLIHIGGKRNGSQTVTTDERGRYTFRSLPGLVRVGHFRFPPTHVQAPGQAWEDFTVPEPPKVIELATREALRAAAPLTGTRRRRSRPGGRGASIQASWRVTGGNGSSDGNVSTKTDAKGAFVLVGLGPDATVSITGRFRGRQSKSPVEVQAGEAGPVTVAIVPSPEFAVGGRVLGPDGTPLAEIPIKVQVRTSQNNFPGFPAQVRFEDGRQIKTAPDGSFTTPKEIDRKPSEVRIEVAADGFLPARTTWVVAPEADLLTLPDLRLKRSRGVRIVTGRVVDRAGNPMPGVSVSQAGDGPKWTSAKTGADGRFRLPGVGDGAALVFAEAPGCRFAGAITRNGDDSVEIRLARMTEPTLAAVRTLASPLSRAAERALAKELLGPLLAVARSGSLGIVGPSAIPALARVDPLRVIEMIENRAVGDLSGTLNQVALGQYEDDPAVAITTINDDRDPGSRAAAWLALEAYRPAPDRTRRENLLERALADTHRVARADVKVGLLNRIADRWLDLGSIERARPILREGQAILADWPKDNWFFGAEAFAATLAVIDLPAATAIFERRGWTNVSRPDANTLTTHNGQAAIGLAGINPAEAERLLAPPSAGFFGREWIVLKVVRKMARVDLPRARRVLETIDHESSGGMTASPALVPFGVGANRRRAGQHKPSRGPTNAGRGLRRPPPDRG